MPPQDNNKRRAIPAEDLYVLDSSSESGLTESKNVSHAPFLRNANLTIAGREMGYFLLEDCDVSVKSTCHTGNASVSVDRKWVKVEIVNSEPDRAQAWGTPCSPGEFHAHRDDQDSADRCQHCNLVLRMERTDLLKLDLARVPPFDGNVAGVFSPSCPLKCARRSDASLLVGILALFSGVVTIRSLRVFFKDDKLQKAALVLTVDFPHLSLDRPGMRSILPTQNARSRSKVAVKALHPGLQLILSLVRSDWTHLQNRTQNIEHNKEKEEDRVTSRRQTPSFFPFKISLGGIYERIAGTSNDSLREKHLNERRQHQPSTCDLAHLPREILTENVAPFLRARSLESLRCSCSYLHSALQGIAPGLKLRLYNHQVSSLSWMRSREVGALSESNLLEDDFSSSESSAQFCLESDLHRAATGGLTSRLVSRPQKGLETSSDFSVRLDQRSGREVNPESIDSLSRNIARGGLLCDDPGLGKTITILGLILQTSGLSTTPQSRPVKDVGTSNPTSRSHTDEKIFQTYWSEQLIAEFREPLLLKLVNELAKKDAGGAYFPVRLIRKLIEESDFGADFISFQKAVE
jgi:hypothetical protein